MTDIEIAEHIAEHVDLNLKTRRDRAIIATYRLQFHKNFTFQNAIGVVSYLAELGISHVYASPILKAKPDSPHGYDVCDYSQLNPELGTESDFQQLIKALHERHMGMILDFVPNHMSATTYNEWWNDVLENGPNSPYASHFDIDWHPVKHELENKILLPILDQQYGEVLESGKLELQHVEGKVVLKYFDNVLPIGPKTAIPFLTDNIERVRVLLQNNTEQFEEFQSIITALAQLPAQTATEPEKVIERHREKEVIRRRLRRLEFECVAITEHIESNIKDFNGDTSNSKSFDRLDGILSNQAYRLCHWKTASDEINYRRFFDVNELTAVCMEHQNVFDAAHGKIIELLANGDLDGLRIDHIDGLYDPVEYLWRLQRAYVTELGRRELEQFKIEKDHDPNDQMPQWDIIRPHFIASLAVRLSLPGLCERTKESTSPFASQQPPAKQIDLPLYVLVEKILGTDETLPIEWPVDGTTGYEFLNILNGLLLDGKGWKELNKIYSRFIEDSTGFSETVLNSKRLILRVAMASELQMLAHRLNRISEQHRRSRDFTLNTLRSALQEILAYFPVYRAYPGPGALPERDRRFINVAIAKARRNNPAIDGSVFDFIRKVLLLEHPEGVTGKDLAERELFAGRFQQVTSPVMAKGMEDTSFYVHFPLVSVNEVGAYPASPVATIAGFHKENIVRQNYWPRSMLTTSTHDTKRSEDFRARLQVLSESPKVWRRTLQRWSRLNRRFIKEVDGLNAPSRNDEYLFYQTIIGMWPDVEPNSQQLESLTERAIEFMLKAIHEAKVQTSWISPNAAYDKAVTDFVKNTLSTARDNRFVSAIQETVNQISTIGYHNALTQTLLKLLSPGVPDIYQGQEFWDFSLVDPDNRRPVDFGIRESELAKLKEIYSAGQEKQFEFACSLKNDLRNPLLKLLVVWRSLQIREQCNASFGKSEYIPLKCSGIGTEHICAFARKFYSDDNRAIYCIVIVPRLLLALTAGHNHDGDALFANDVWQHTRVRFPEIPEKHFTHAFTGQEVSTDHSELIITELLQDFPVALLISK